MYVCPFEVLHSCGSRETIIGCLRTGNHNKIFPVYGIEIRKYRYWDPSTRGLNFAGMIEDLTVSDSLVVCILLSSAALPTNEYAVARRLRRTVPSSCFTRAHTTLRASTPRQSNGRRFACFARVSLVDAGRPIPPSVQPRLCFTRLPTLRTEYHSAPCPALS